jgi:hypothetical protein
MLGFKAFDEAQATQAGIELIHMLKKRQMVVEAGAKDLTAAEQFYMLAAEPSTEAAAAAASAPPEQNLRQYPKKLTCQPGCIWRLSGNKVFKR